MSIEKIDALLKQLQKTEGVSSGVRWEHFEKEIAFAAEKLSAIHTDIHSKDAEYSAPLSLLMKLGSSISALGSALSLLHDHDMIRADVSSSFRRMSDNVVSVGHDVMSLANELQDPHNTTDTIREP